MYVFKQKTRMPSASRKQVPRKYFKSVLSGLGHVTLLFRWVMSHTSHHAKIERPTRIFFAVHIQKSCSPAFHKKFLGIFVWPSLVSRPLESRKMENNQKGKGTGLEFFAGIVHGHMCVKFQCSA